MQPTKVLFPSLLNALPYPKMTLFSHFFRSFKRKQNTHHPLRGSAVVQKWMGGVGATYAILKKRLSKTFFYDYIFILRNFCHRIDENRMFLGFLWSETNYTRVLTFCRAIVTLYGNWCVFCFVLFCFVVVVVVVVVVVFLWKEGTKTYT